MASVRRHPTLEAQMESFSRKTGLRQKVSSWLVGPKIPNDTTEQLFEALISETTGSRRMFFEDLVRDYEYFKRCPSHPIASRVFQGWTFKKCDSSGTPQCIFLDSEVGGTQMH